MLRRPPVHHDVLPSRRCACHTLQRPAKGLLLNHNTTQQMRGIDCCLIFNTLIMPAWLTHSLPVVVSPWWYVGFIACDINVNERTTVAGSCGRW